MADFNPAPGVRLFIVDDAAIVYAHGAQKLAAFNPAATFIWCAFELGQGQAEVAQGLAKTAGLSAAEVVEEGDPKVTLVEHAERWGADTIFVGATGLSRTQRFFPGSVSNAIAARAHCSVEVVRSLEGMANVVRSVE